MRVLEIGPARNKAACRSWKTLNCKKARGIDYVRDITKPLVGMPKFDLVYMSHVLEHIPWWMATQTLRNIRAIIVPGGSIEIWVPDFSKIVEMYQNPDMSRDKFRMHNPKANPYLWLAGRIFAGTTHQPKVYTKLSVWHKSLWDEKHLSESLIDAGYRNPERLEKPRGYDHGWVNLGVRASA